MAACVAFGDTVDVLSVPREQPEQVWKLRALGGTEPFGLGFDVVDGLLNLTNGEGLRLLAVVSDGNFSKKELATAHREVQRLVSMGGIVLWFGAHDEVPGALMIPVEDDGWWATLPRELLRVLQAHLAS